jgi:hypothetical protein
MSMWHTRISRTSRELKYPLRGDLVRVFYFYVLFEHGRGRNFTAIPAVICGHIAWSKICKSGGALRGKGIATAGLTLGYIGLALGILGIPLLVGMIQSDRERAHRLATERKEIVDGKIKVTVPGTRTSCRSSTNRRRCKWVTRAKKCI